MFHTGCVTQKAVERIVIESNLAMIAPYIDRPGQEGRQPEGWKEAIRKMDAIIEQHSGELVLVNQLKVRQAMLLTVNKKDALARQMWATIDRSALRTERDKALYDASSSLVWAYKALSESALISEAVAAPYISTLDRVLDGLHASDLKIYFHTVRAQTQLKVANGLDEDKDSEAKRAPELLARSLMTFVGAFSSQDHQWVQQADADGGDLDIQISDFRQRIWLRSLIQEYRREANRKGYTPQWQPAWVGTVPLD